MEAHVGAGVILVRPGEHDHMMRHRADQAAHGDRGELSVAYGRTDALDLKVIRGRQVQDALEVLGGVDVLDCVS